MLLCRWRLSMSGEFGIWVVSWLLKPTYKDVKTSGFGEPVVAEPDATLCSDGVPGLADFCSRSLPAQCLGEAVPATHANHRGNSLQPRKRSPDQANYLDAPALAPSGHQSGISYWALLRRAVGEHAAVPASNWGSLLALKFRNNTESRITL